MGKKYSRGNRLTERTYIGRMCIPVRVAARSRGKDIIGVGRESFTRISRTLKSATRDRNP